MFRVRYAGVQYSTLRPAVKVARVSNESAPSPLLTVCNLAIPMSAPNDLQPESPSTLQLLRWAARRVRCAPPFSPRAPSWAKPHNAPARSSSPPRGARKRARLSAVASSKCCLQGGGGRGRGLDALVHRAARGVDLLRVGAAPLRLLEQPLCGAPESSGLGARRNGHSASRYSRRARRGDTRRNHTRADQEIGRPSIRHAPACAPPPLPVRRPLTG